MLIPGTVDSFFQEVLMTTPDTAHEVQELLGNTQIILKGCLALLGALGVQSWDSRRFLGGSKV